MSDRSALDFGGEKPYLEILIPTFNREPFLRKNLNNIKEQLLSANLNEKVRILISDNASSDGTSKMIDDFRIDNKNIQMKFWSQDTNLGLESNAVFLLSRSVAEYVMYLGDDDYLPTGYIVNVLRFLQQSDYSCIIPGISALYDDGTIVPSRVAPFEQKEFSKGYRSVLKISHFGHQLSGIVFRRNGVYDAYMQSQEYRNIYPFIFFTAFCILRGTALFAPKFQVLVSQSNPKDWKYDESGLLKDIVKNYSALFGFFSLKKCLAEINFMARQSWRLRISPRKPILTLRCFFDLILSRDVHLLSKVLLPFLYFFVIGKRLTRKTLSFMHGGQ